MFICRTLWHQASQRDPDVAYPEPGDRAQEACAGQQVDPDRAEDQLGRVGHHEGAVQAAAERGQRAAEDDHHRGDPLLQEAAAEGAVRADHTIEIDASYDSHSPIDCLPQA